MDTPSQPPDPSDLMSPDARRLRALADGLADEGETGLSNIVRAAADDLDAPSAAGGEEE